MLFAGACLHLGGLYKLILKENTFSFGDHIHRRQTRGCAMGSTVSPSLDIIFMDQLERRLLDTASDRRRSVFYVRYIDDIFMIWTHGTFYSALTPDTTLLRW